MNWQNCSIPIFDEMQEHDIRYLNLAKREAIWTIPNINFSKKAERMLTVSVKFHFELFNNNL